MTALDQYQRLEAVGVWRETPLAAKRDVIVSFGDATLVLADPRSDMPLSHWSLPAVTRTNPGKMPATYSPGGADTDELLEIDDDLMIAAIEKVHRAIAASRPNAGRLRSGAAALIVLALLAGAVWLPPALMRHAAQVAPPAQRAAIGARILSDVEEITGAACSRPAAAVAARDFAERLLGPGRQIAVLPTTHHGAVRLPGPVTIVGVDLMSAGNSPEVVAGHILAAEARAQEADPLLTALRFAGLRATLRLMATGALSGETLEGYGQRLLSAPRPEPDDEHLLALFERAGIPSEPYARALDPTGEATLGLIEADPFRTALPRGPILGDDEWHALQQICDE